MPGDPRARAMTDQATLALLRAKKASGSSAPDPKGQPSQRNRPLRPFATPGGRYKSQEDFAADLREATRRSRETAAREAIEAGDRSADASSSTALPSSASNATVREQYGKGRPPEPRTPKGPGKGGKTRNPSEADSVTGPECPICLDPISARDRRASCRSHAPPYTTPSMLE